MLDLGFLEDVEKILSFTPGGRQTALFSATMPAEIRALAERHLYDPVTVKVKSATLTIDTVEQFFLETRRPTRSTRSCACSRPSGPTRRSSSCARRSAASSSTARCATAGMNVKALHGDMSQGSRDGVMISFKDERVQILVATDVAARGLDITTVTHIINFDVPTSPDVYVHRIGRTGRVGPLGPRDHVRRAAAGARARGDREARQHAHRAVGRGRARRSGEGAGPPAPPPQAARRAGGRQRRAPQADRLGRPRRGPRRGRPDRRRHRHGPRRRGDPQRAPARALRALRGARRRRPSAWPRASTAPRSAATRCGWNSRRDRCGGTTDVDDDHDHEQGRHRVRDVRRRRAQDRREHPQAGREGLLRRAHVPPRHPRLHDPGRLPAGHRHGRARTTRSRTSSTSTRSSAGRSPWPTPGPNTNGSPVLHRDRRRGAVARRQAHRVRAGHVGHGRGRRARGAAHRRAAIAPQEPVGSRSGV